MKRYVRPLIALVTVGLFLACSALTGNPADASKLDQILEILNDPNATPDALQQAMAQLVQVLGEWRKSAEQVDFGQVAGGGLTGLVAYLVMNWRRKLLETPPPVQES